MKKSFLRCKFYFRNKVTILLKKKLYYCMILVLLIISTKYSLLGQTIVTTITRPGLEPWSLAVYEAGNKLLVNDYKTGHLLIYDCTSLAMLAELTIEEGVNDFSMQIDETSGRAYITTGDYVAVIDINTYQLINHINIDTYWLEKDEVLRKLYGIGLYEPILYVINMNTDEYQTVPLSDHGLTSGLGVNPVTHEVFVGYLHYNQLDIIDGNTLKRTNVIGENGRSIAVNWKDNKIYTTTAGWGGYWIFNRNDNSSKITNCVNDGTMLFYNSKSNRVYTSAEVNREVTVIDGATDECYPISLKENASALCFVNETSHVYFSGVNSTKIYNEISDEIKTIEISNPYPSSALIQAIAVNQSNRRVFIVNDAKALHAISVIQDTLFGFPSKLLEVITTSNPWYGGSTSGSGSFIAGQSVTVTATPNSGYNFISWSENNVVVSTNPIYQFKINNKRKLEANFVRVYTISTNSEPWYGGSTSGGGVYTLGQSVTVTAIPNIGYIFSKWLEYGQTVSTDINYRFTVDGYRTLVAYFIDKSHINEKESGKPVTFELFQNYPNPFNPTTTIEFQLPKSSFVIIKVINLAGKEVSTLVENQYAAGSYRTEWKASNIPSGIYYCRIQADKYSKTLKMILMQ